MILAYFHLETLPGAHVLRLAGGEPTNLLSCARVTSLTAAILELRSQPKPLILAGNERFFSVGADLNEVAALTASSAYEFAAMGQNLMNAVADFPAPSIAAISGFCMGGGLDLALACSHRIATAHSIFGHRGASLGIITGWGGTQRLPEIVGKGRALQMFLCAEKVTASKALEIGLIDALSEDPVDTALQRVSTK